MTIGKCLPSLSKKGHAFKRYDVIYYMLYLGCYPFEGATMVAIHRGGFQDFVRHDAARFLV